MRNKIFSLVIALLLILGIGIFVLPQSEISNNERRDLATNKSLTIDANSLENVLKDQFYFRDFITTKYYELKLALNDVPYKLINIYQGQDYGYKYLSKDLIELSGGYLINDILRYDESKLNDVNSRAYNVNQIDLKYPDIKTYIYFPTRIEEILIMGDNENYGIEYRNAYIRQLNENISYSSLELSGIDEYETLFYKSDFHWNGYGAYRGYKDIIEMIGKDFDIGNVKTIKEELTYNYLWKGNESAEIGLVSEGDYLIDLKLNDIGEYTYYVDGKQKTYGSEKDYYKENGNSSVYSDYNVYFGDNNLERRFEFNDESKPNILVFCDSFINVNQEWIASHFNKTVYIDLRADDGSFNLDEYIDKYDIDIILVSEMYQNMYFNGYMYIPVE